ncbi:uncharacterized protein [Diadema antillarum]|uniref:uncharacterized protein n=1 Tax=Diadema antillarum TaxID=105358 RepID=UPI003A8401A0
MAFNGHGRPVKTYGRNKKKMTQDNWISPHLFGVRRISNVFSSPENESTHALSADASIEVLEKENIIPPVDGDSKKPRRKAARKAKAALEDLATEVNSEGDNDKKRKREPKKGRRFTKLSRKYKKVEEGDTEVDDDIVVSIQQPQRKGGRLASEPSDLSFDLIYDITKKKKASSSSADDDSIISPILLCKDECEKGRVAVETSTPCGAEEHSIGRRVETKGHVTRRRMKGGDPSSPDGHGRQRRKQRRVLASNILSFDEDELLAGEPPRLPSRISDVSDAARRLSAIDLSDITIDRDKSRTQPCHVKLHKLSHDSLVVSANATIDLFSEDEEGSTGDNSCLVSCKEQQRLLSGVGHRSSVADASSEKQSSRISKSSSGRIKPLCQLRDRNKSQNELLFNTPANNKTISRLALDSFKVALTPTRGKRTGRLLPPRQKVLAQCGQEDITDFSSCIPATMMTKCIKIGEGVYGEVFRSKHKCSSVALKVIPIEGDFPVNEESQKTFEEILPEIVISRELSKLRDGDHNRSSNFIQVNRVACVRGSYPKKLLDEWDKFDRKKTSENDRPDIFPSDQLFIIFEFADGGKDLEGFEFENVHQAVSVLQQVTGALAVAERELDFEHRDLHWGNVLVKGTKEDQVWLTVGNREVSVDSHGLHVSIIDFTLSRLQKDDCTVYCDLAEDPTLFTGEGDKQFDVYRAMQEHNSNRWEAFNPKTNVFWIEYLLHKLIWEKKYPSDRAQRKVLGQLKSLCRELGQFSSAEDVMLNSELLRL